MVDLITPEEFRYPPLAKWKPGPETPLKELARAQARIIHAAFKTAPRSKPPMHLIAKWNNFPHDVRVDVAMEYLDDWNIQPDYKVWEKRR